MSGTETGRATLSLPELIEKLRILLLMMLRLEVIQAGCGLQFVGLMRTGSFSRAYSPRPSRLCGDAVSLPASGSCYPGWIDQ
jgi:hypothetical protein